MKLEEYEEALLMLVKSALAPYKKSPTSSKPTKKLLESFPLIHSREVEQSNHLQIDIRLLPSTRSNWQQLMNLAAAQGVYAIALDGLDEICLINCPDSIINISSFDNLYRNKVHNTLDLKSIINQRLPRDLRIQWELGRMSIEKRYLDQAEAVEKLVSIFERNGISMMVLKGVGLSAFYPKSEHRECGDIDIYLMGKFEEGNKLIANMGFIVEKEGDKHSRFFFNGYAVENHKTFLNTTLSIVDKRLEIVLDDLISPYKECVTKFLFNESLSVITPSPDFNAVFLARHAIKHFLIGGLVLRHITDLALFFEMNSDRINFAKLAQTLRIHNQLTLLISFLAVAKKHLAIGKGYDNLYVYGGVNEKVVSQIIEDLFASRMNRFSRDIKNVGKPRTLARIIWGIKCFYMSKRRYNTTGIGTFFEDFLCLSKRALKILFKDIFGRKIISKFRQNIF